MKELRNQKLPKFSDSPVKRYRIIFHGRVQGVGFRYNTYEIASRLSLTGWVENRADGTVEAEDQGPENKIDYLIDYMKKLPIPNVEKVEKEVLKLKKEDGFRLS